MAYYSSDHIHHTGRYDSYGLPRHESSQRSSAGQKLTDMVHSVSQSGYPHHNPTYASYDPNYAAYPAAPGLPPRPSANTRHHPRARSVRSWPPSPSVEDEKVSLAREVPLSTGTSGETDEEVRSRGSVDQFPILEQVLFPKHEPEYSDDRRFVLVSDPRASGEGPGSNEQDRRRKSFAERGNMAPLDTGVLDPPLFTERVSAPYAYTKPVKESLAPSAHYTLSPEPVTPGSSAVPRSVPTRDSWDSGRDQNVRPQRPPRSHTRYDSKAQPSKPPQKDVFEESDSDDSTYLRTDRKPARYSFVKSDLQKDDLRTSLLDNQTSTEAKRTDRTATYSSSASSKNPTPRSQSPPSPGSSRTNTMYSRHHASAQMPTQASVHTLPLRTGSPSPQEQLPPSPRSPRLPERRTDEHTQPSRPSSRHYPSRPASPLAPRDGPIPSRVPITEADWHATYPPVTVNDRPTQSARLNRHETMPVPAPRIDIQSPSPARPPKAESSLPYPIDDRLADVFMPQEEAYQFEPSYAPPSPGRRSPYPGSPKVPQSPVPTFSRLSVDEDEQSRTRVRSDSLRSRSRDGRRTNRRALSLDNPIPVCPRSEPSTEYEDWYTLESCPNFDICPSCYRKVFADTEFADYFRPVVRRDSRYCDFASPWMRLAWLMTIKQQRSEPDLIYQLAAIMDRERPCPKDSQVIGGEWYGIPDPRNGIHVANFSICKCDLRMLEALCPRIRGYFTRLPSMGHYDMALPKHTCALRTSSKRFAKYLDLLVELDEEARSTNRPVDIARFVKLAREYAFRAECQRDKPLMRTPWHFIPQLPEFTVCEECYDDLVWPAIREKNSVAKLFPGTTRLVPDEEQYGTSCCLYSPRMRRVWKTVLEKEDYSYLKRRAIERKRKEKRYLESKTRLKDYLRSGSPLYRDRALENLEEIHRLRQHDWDDVK